MKRSINPVKLTALALAILCLAGWAVVADRSASAQSGTAYHAVTDFSATQNPNGAWSYGFTQTRGTAFTRMTMPISDANYSYWGATSLGPFVVKNNTGATINDGARSHPPDMLNLDPSHDGRNSVVRWTAPASGTYRIAGRFQGLDNTTTDVAVLKNSSETLLSGNINGKGAQTPFDLTVSVAANDTIDFSVGQGTSGSLFDGTGLAVSITSTLAGSCVNSPAGTVAWYPGEGNATDVQGVNNGVMHNGVVFAPGKVGQAFSFDGIDDYVTFGTSLGGVGAADFAVEFWLQTPNNARGEAILSKRACTFSEGGYLDIRKNADGKLFVELDNNGTN